MKLSKGIQFFAPPPELFRLYLSDNYYISIGSDFDPVFTVGKNFIEGDYSFNASSSGTATDIDYTVSGNKITFTKNISGIGYTDFNTVNVAVGGTFSSSSTSSHDFYVVPAAVTQTTYDLTNLNLSAGNYAITVVAEAEGFTDSDASNSVNYTVQDQLAAPTIAMNADGKTLEITDVENATSYDVYVDGTLKTNVARPVGYTVTFGGTSVSSSEIGNVTVTIPNEQQFQLTNATVVKNNVSLFTLGGTTAADMRVVVEMGGTSTQYEVFENIDINVTGNATVYLKNKYV